MGPVPQKSAANLGDKIKRVARTEMIYDPHL